MFRLRRNRNRKRKDGLSTTASASESESDGIQSVPSLTKEKVLSRRFFECPADDLILLVASMLQELVAINDQLPFDAGQLTRFHSRSPPQISIHDYLKRIVRFCSLEKSILLCMVYFIDLLCRAHPVFRLNSLTVHRFLITAATVGSKGLCDAFCTNAHYAKVGGLSRFELNLLEIEFLVRVDYCIVPQLQVLDQYYESMAQRMIGNGYMWDEDEDFGSASAASGDEYTISLVEPAPKPQQAHSEEATHRPRSPFHSPFVMPAKSPDVASIAGSAASIASIKSVTSATTVGLTTSRDGSPDSPATASATTALSVTLNADRPNLRRSSTKRTRGDNTQSPKRVRTTPRVGPSDSPH